jgi:tetraether lipid synthase
VASEGEPEVVMFSGGEPTIHPEILGFMRMAAEKGVRIVNLNTNGMRLAHDRKFMKDLSELPKRPNIYMQFDGFAERTHTEIRGRDLRNAKQKALDNSAEFGLNVTLVAAVERDLNDHESATSSASGSSNPPCARWPTSPSPTPDATSSSTR